MPRILPSSMPPLQAARFVSTAALMLVFAGLAGAQTGQKTVPSLSQIVDAMERAQAASRIPTSYQVIREYRLSGAKGTGADSTVVGEVNIASATNKSYSIQKAAGSVRGQQVVKRVLEHEVQHATAENQARSALAEANYNFEYLGENVLNGQRCFVLGLRPKRKEPELIQGQAWVDMHSFFIQAIEGDLAKTPSWWLKRVHVKFGFDDIEGIRLQTSMEAVAEVRILGSHTMTSQLVDFRSGDLIAFVDPHTNRLKRR